MTDQTTISRQPEPLAMNFELLRAEGIRHLEKLATHIWTDFNAHDPGITILEVLCYALTDLGYRVNFPLEDILATESGNNEGIFFPADLTLSMGPVTELDYRKLLIDLPGVKNAWLEKAKGEYKIDFEPLKFNRLIKDQQGEITQEELTIASELYDKYQIEINEDDDPSIRDKVIELITHLFEAPENAMNKVGRLRDFSNKLADEIICTYAYFPVTKEAVNDKGTLNGLFNVLLDLHDPTLNKLSAEAKPIIKKVTRRLHQNRNLCEDLVDVQIVEPQHICLCLHLEIKPDADPVEVMAEAVFQLQDFLTPTVKFHTLQQLLEQGKSGDQIYDGPLLSQGFLMDEEVEKAVLRTKIYKSDLYDVLADIPEILNVLELKLDVKDAGFDDGWEYNIDKDHKPIIFVCCKKNQLWTSQGAVKTQVFGADIESLIEFKELVNLDIPDSDIDSLLIPKGVFRPDLDDYTSIQHDFPRNYALGKNALPDSVGPNRLAQVKQLKAYLLFFDRLLANFLKQLSHVRDLFAVNRDPEMNTVFFQTLYQVPGVEELLKGFPYVNEERIGEITAKLEEKVIDNEIEEASKTMILGQLKMNINIKFVSDEACRESMMQWVSNVEKVTDRPIVLAIVENVILDNFLSQLQGIALGEGEGQGRKNLLLNHLLARFGEQFTDYALSLYQSTTETDAYQSYLNDKTGYLRLAPILIKERAKAYDYQLFKADRPEPDVWNTANMAGLKKRMYALLGIDGQTESVFCDPDFRIKLLRDESKNQAAYFLQLIELEENGSDENRKDGRVLLISQNSYRKSKAEAYEKAIYEGIGLTGNFKIDKATKQSNRSQLQYEIKPEKLAKISLFSEPMSKNRAEQLKEDIFALINPTCEKEGFHLLEHILLRPNDNADKLLHAPHACKETPLKIDPYSFWLSVVLPGWTRRFKDQKFRHYFEQLFLTHTPAHIAVCFRWVEEEDKAWMRQFEHAYELWREALAQCTPDECDVTDKANELVDLLSELPCPCWCDKRRDYDSVCVCP